MAEEPASKPTAKNCGLREELAQNRGILRWPCGRFEQSDTGESCGVEMAERVGLSSTDLPDARNPINKGLLAAGENRCVPPVCTTFRGLRQASWLSWRPAVEQRNKMMGFGDMVPSRGLDYFSRASALRGDRSVFDGETELRIRGRVIIRSIPPGIC